MLPKNLVVFSKNHGKIVPEFLYSNERIEYILSFFKEGEKIFKPEFLGSDYKVLSGIFHTIKKLSKWRKVREDSREIRKFLFSFGPVLTKEEKERVVSLAKDKFNFSSLDEIWGDMEDNMIWEGISYSPDDIRKFYNLYLLSSFFFYSKRVFFLFRENLVKVLRGIKRFGLMYDVVSMDGKNFVEVFGPISLLKETTKYGYGIANFFSNYFEYIQKVVAITDFGKLDVEINKDLFPKCESEILFSSSLEMELFSALKHAFGDVKKDPDIIKTKDGFFVPDFLVKDVYIELAGFWTEEYIKRKIEKIKNSKINIIIVANEELNLGEKGIKEENVITFKNKLPLLDVILKVREKVGDDRDGKEEENEEESWKEIKVKEELSDGMDIKTAFQILKKFGLKKEDLPKLGYTIELKTLIPPEGKIKKIEK